MSSYGIASAYYTPAAYYDHKFQHYNAINKPNNFSVSHLLDLEELPRENCAMYANTDMTHKASNHSGGPGGPGMLLHTVPDRPSPASPPLSPNKLINNNNSSNMTSSCIHIKPSSLSPDLDKKSGESIRPLEASEALFYNRRHCL